MMAFLELLHTLLDASLGVNFIVSVPLYLSLLLVMLKFRKKAPFDGTFFTIAFSLGVFDLCHLCQAWIFGECVRHGWLGVHKLVVIWPHFFAKITSMIWWFLALGQTLGVLFMAAHRLSVIGYDREWLPKETRAAMATFWLLPAILTLPQLSLDFKYEHINKTGGLELKWLNKDYQLLYYLSCFLWCAILAIAMAVMYGLAFWKVHKHRQQMQSSNVGGNKRSEIRLAVVGFVLFVFRLCCAALCGAAGLMRSEEIMQFEHVLGDLESSMQPYLLLAFSKPVRKHLKCMLKCKSENRVSNVPVKRNNLVGTK